MLCQHVVAFSEAIGSPTVQNDACRDFLTFRRRGFDALLTDQPTGAGPSEISLLKHQAGAAEERAGIEQSVQRCEQQILRRHQNAHGSLSLDVEHF